MISERSVKRLNDVIFKFLWNRKFNGVRAPDRVKREIIYTPVSKGGFGLIDIRELDEAIKLKSLGRIFTTNHPLFSQMKDRIKLTNFFNAEINIHCDDMLKMSLTILNKTRRRLLSWTTEVLYGNAAFVSMIRSTRLSNILTPAGRRGLHYYMITRRMPEVKIGDISEAEFTNFRQNLLFPSLYNAIRIILGRGINPRMQASNLLIPLKSGALSVLTKLSSKEIRDSGDDKLICAYKIGLNLNQGQVLNWCNRLRKVTSIRLRSTLLRVAHGDIYSNSRMYKFGMVDNAKCANCDEPVETIIHILFLCPKAQRVWNMLNDKKASVGLDNTQLNIEGILGIDSNDTLDLTLNAATLQKLISLAGEPYCPDLLVERVLKSIYYNDKRGKILKELMTF